MKVRSGVVAAAGLALATAIAARAIVSWSNGTYLSYAEGVWAALAMSASQGEWYRPISGPDGYGGTRYWPLVFAVHGTLLRIWADVFATGLALSIISFVAALAALFALARTFGLSRTCAAVAVLIFAASTSVQYGLLAIRGDLLPLACLLAGAALARRSPVASAIALTLAVSGKPTMAYGAVAVAGWLLASRDWRAFVAFGATFALGVSAMLGVMQWISDGRALPLLLSGTAAGGGLRTLLGAPRVMVRVMSGVPETAIAIVAGLCFACAALFRSDTGLRRAALLFGGALAVTLVVFATPATWLNHLADLQAASALLIVLAAAQSSRAWQVAGLSAAALTLVTGLATTTSRAIGPDHSDRLKSYRAVFAWLDNHPGEFLADQLILAPLAHRRSFIIDSYILQVHVAVDPSRMQPLLDALARRRFVAVILDDDLSKTTPEALIDEAAFGQTYMRTVFENYKLETVLWGRSILVPR